MDIDPTRPFPFLTRSFFMESAHRVVGENHAIMGLTKQVPSFNHSKQKLKTHV